MIHFIVQVGCSAIYAASRWILCIFLIIFTTNLKTWFDVLSHLSKWSCLIMYLLSLIATMKSVNRFLSVQTFLCWCIMKFQDLLHCILIVFFTPSNHVIGYHKLLMKPFSIFQRMGNNEWTTSPKWDQICEWANRWTKLTVIPLIK